MRRYLNTCRRKEPGNLSRCTDVAAAGAATVPEATVVALIPVIIDTDRNKLIEVLCRPCRGNPVSLVLVLVSFLSFTPDAALKVKELPDFYEGVQYLFVILFFIDTLCSFLFRDMYGLLPAVVKCVRMYICGFVQHGYSILAVIARRVYKLIKNRLFFG